MQRRIYIIMMFFFAASLCLAQKPFRLGANFAYGFVWPHRASMKHLVQGHTEILELNWERPTSGEHEWETIYHKPSWGITAIAAFLGNPTEIGNGFGIYPYFRLPLTKNEKWDVNFKVGSGFGILTKPFDADNNYKNIAIGSYVNGIICLQFDVERIYNKNRFLLGLSLTHFSNASFKKPNLGFNIPTLKIGLLHQFGALEDKQTISSPDEYLQNKWTLYTTAAMGIKEIYPPEGNKFSAYSLNIELIRKMNKKSGFTAGVDFFLNKAIQAQLEMDTVFITNAQLMQEGINFGYRQQIGRFSLMIQFGAYLHTYYKEDGQYYHRLGFDYYAGKHIIIHWGLKTHWAKADHFELGLGYRINLQKTNANITTDL